MRTITCLFSSVLFSALASISVHAQGGGLPAKPELKSPSGKITDTTPTYSWGATANTDKYKVQVYDNTGRVISNWYTAKEVGCGSGSGTCSLNSSTVLAYGSGKWRVRGKNGSGKGPFSDYLNFTVEKASTGLTGTPALISPSGNITDNTPTYSWAALAYAEDYKVQVYDKTGRVISRWYSAKEVGCGSGSGTCSLTSSTVLADGSGKWRVKGRNDTTKGAYSDYLNFTVDSNGGGETTPVNTAPSVTITAPTNDTSIDEGTQLTLSGVASDKEEGDLSANISWSSSLDGSLATTTNLSVGTHTITASVSDSDGLTATDQINLTVTATKPSTVTATLSWNIPDSRENGEALELYEIGGYEILFKKAGDSLYYSETITDAQVSNHVISDLEPGDYEFKITAYDTEGLYSTYTITTAVVQ